MEDDSRIDALHVMLQAQGLLIEHLWANHLANQSPADSLRIKSAIVSGAGNGVESYSGGPKDVEELQRWASVLQNHMRDIVESIQQREEHARKSQGQPPLGKYRFS